MSYLELFNLMTNPWSSFKEIQLIAKCGRDTAIKIRKSIEQEIIKDGKKLPYAKTIYVPTQMVIEFLGLDIDYIKKMAQYETETINKNRISNYASISG